MVSQQGLLWGGLHVSEAVIFLHLTCQLLPCYIPVSNREQHMTTTGTSATYYPESVMSSRKWDVIYTTEKPPSTFFLPGTNGILSQLTLLSTPLQLSRGRRSKCLADFTSCQWCCIRLDTEIF